MKRHIQTLLKIALAFAILAGAASAEIAHYAGSVQLDPATRIVTADIRLTIAHPIHSLKLYLNKDLHVQSAQCALCVGFSEDASKAGEYRNAPFAAPVLITLKSAPANSNPVTIILRYSGKLADIPDDTSSFTPEWIELGMIESQWLPFDPESERFTYDLNVNLPSDYKLIANARPSGTNGHWHLQQSSPSFDIDIAAARNLQFHHFNSPDLQLTTASITAPQDFLDRFAHDTAQIAQVYTKWFGTASSNRLTVVLNPRQGSSYSRTGYISLCYSKDPADYDSMLYTMSHEVAHFWWGRAPSDTWENWLNEAFAEYTALMYLRSTKGQAAFDEQIAKFERRVKDTPPLWGIDRHAPRAAAVIYAKGALRLHSLEQTLAADRFLKFLRTLFQKNVKTTQGLLAELQREDGTTISKQFEQSLHQ